MATQLEASGWTSRTFQHVVSEADKPDSLWPELFPGADLSLLDKAALKASWSLLQSGSAPASGSGVAVQPLSQEGSWTDTFAPKIEGARLSDLKKEFLTNYPSEVLTHSTIPSTRLISLAAHQESKKEYK